MSSLAIGIDLGTTFSAVAHVNQHGVPEILPNTHGDRITPSIILFEGDDIVIGIEAQRNAVAYPEQVVQFVKRHMGDNDFHFFYRGKNWNAVELSSLILRDLKKGAEARLRKTVKQAVVTVPAYFGDKERRATIAAGEMAGLEVLKIINEPTAAAVAYGINHLGSERRCLVFDLGGGTFDVTIIIIEGNSIRVRSTAGDHQLGGKDWDDRLIKHLADKFKKEYNMDPLEDALATHELRGRCVSAKLTLTMRPEVKIDFRYKGRPLRTTVTREEFEGLTADLLARTEEMTRYALQEANFSIDDIDTVLLVGGSTRMPMVRKRIREMFNREPSTEINPDECVALGAALTAALTAAHQQGQKPPVDVSTHDVSGHSLGMVAYKDGNLSNTHIIKRNTPIPCERKKEHFTTTHPGQSMIDLWLLQGERKDPLACNELGHFEFYGIPARPAGQSQISITYRYNENGIVEVEATDMMTGKLLSHRLSADRYTLKDLKKNKIPAHIAVIVDCSGSMYGEPMEAARIAIRRFTDQLLKPNRTMAIFAHPGAAKPVVVTSNPNDVYPILGNLIPIGDSAIQRALMLARKALKDRGGIYIIVSDGKVENEEPIRKECERIRKFGGRVFTIGVGPAVEKDFLLQLCATPKDYFDAYEAVDISHALVNIVTDIS